MGVQWGKLTLESLNIQIRVRLFLYFLSLVKVINYNSWCCEIATKLLEKWKLSPAVLFVNPSVTLVTFKNEERKEDIELT